MSVMEGGTVHQGDDESICNKSEACKNMFHCRNTKQICLHLGNTCDGHNDCPSGDDEMLCELKLVYCPTYCLCLLYAIDCTAVADETFKIVYPFSYLFAHLSKFTFISMNTLISLLKYAIVIKLPENEIISICDTLIKINKWKCTILDLSFNLLKSIGSKCFPTINFLKSLKINDNLIKSLGKYSFHNLTKLRYLNVTNNPLIQLHSHFLIQLSYLMIFSIDNIGLLDIYPQAFDDSKINLISTKYYQICCMAPISTTCTAFKPWFIACSDILPSFSMKLFYKTISVTIFILNFVSIILQMRSYKSNKSFSLIVISINGNDILCGVYLSYIWIADLSFGDSFKVKEEKWRSGILCLTAFTTLPLFHIPDRKFTNFIIFIKTYGSNAPFEH